MLDPLMAWLATFYDWITAQILAVFGDFINVFMDLFVWIIDGLFMLILIIIGLIPAPDLSNGFSLAGIIIQLPGSVLWGFEILRVQECLTLITSGYVFYTLRRLMTLGHW